MLVAMLLLGASSLALVVFYAYLDYRIARDLGGRFGIRGRYFVPAISAQMVWLAVGLTAPVPQSWRRVWLWLLGGGMAGLNLFSILRFSLAHHYGTGGFRTLLERAAVLQPVSYPVLLALCGALVVLVAAVLGAVWGALGAEGPADAALAAD
jgi:hypothetical protein